MVRNGLGNKHRLGWLALFSCLLLRSAPTGPTGIFVSALVSLEMPIDIKPWRHNKGTSKPPTVKIATLNIQSGGGNRINAALCCFRRMNLDIILLTETKLVENRFTKSAEGFEIFALPAKNAFQGGVALAFTRENKNWDLEAFESFGHNVVKAELVSGRHRWLVIGAYIPPSKTSSVTINLLSATIHKFCHRTFKSTILLGDLNVNIDRPQNTRQVETTALLATSGLSDVGDKFRATKGRWTWYQF